MGELTDAVRRMIESLQISSASPGHINEVLQIDPSIDLDSVAGKKGGTDDDSPESLAGDLLKAEKKKGNRSKELAGLIGGSQGQAGNLVNMAKNPAGFVTGLMGTIGKSVPFIAVILAILSLPKVVKTIGDFLTARGSPFDRTLKIRSTEALNAFFSRQEQRNLQIGQRQVIFTTNIGFRNSGGALTGNSFKNLGTGQTTSGPDIGTTRTASVLDKAEGI